MSSYIYLTFCPRREMLQCKLMRVLLLLFSFLFVSMRFILVQPHLTMGGNQLHSGEWRVGSVIFFQLQFVFFLSGNGYVLKKKNLLSSGLVVLPHAVITLSFIFFGGCLKVTRKKVVCQSFLQKRNPFKYHLNPSACYRWRRHFFYFIQNVHHLK